VSPVELKLRAELDQARRELRRMKHAAHAPGAMVSAPVTGSSPPSELEALRGEVTVLTETKQRLSRLYFRQVEENHRRAQKVHELLENLGEINSALDLDTLLARMAATVSRSLGFGVVQIRVREPGSPMLRVRAHAGEDAAERAAAGDERLEDFLSKLSDESKVSSSYFISQRPPSRPTPEAPAPADGEQEWDWQEGDALHVPIYGRIGDLVGSVSVGDPEDALVPSRETVELLEIFGNLAGVAIENARLQRQHDHHAGELEAAGRRVQELHALKTDFISTVSHELRTPLGAIRAYVDTLLSAREEEVPFEQQQGFLKVIHEESERLSRLIESMLDLSRFDAGAMRHVRQPVEFAEILEEAVEELLPGAQAAQVDLKAHIDAADTRIEADRDQIKQLVLHLGNNAVKFTPAGGSVTLRLVADARDVTLEVEDSGVGIPEPLLEKIFERFYQVDSSLVRRYGGMGLGLAICKSIVDWHGGRLSAESVPSRGSRFTVVLPRNGGPRVLVRTGPGARAGTEDVLKMAIEMVAQVMNARVVSLLAPGGPEGALVVQAALGLDERVVREATIRPGHGVAGWVAEHRRPVCVSEPGDRPAGAGPGRVSYRTGTFLSVPLEGEEGLIGILNVTDPVSEKPFGAEDCHLMLHLAERVSEALRAPGEVEDRRAGSKDAARALRKAIPGRELRRDSAGGRVALARAVARALVLPESEVGLVSFAASLEGAGMAGLEGRLPRAEAAPAPDREAEPGTLSESDVEPLRPLEAFGAVRDIVLSQHEWWDGSGYPRGLKAREIPVGSRILAVVDAFTGLVAGQARRPAQSRAEAMRELRRLADTRFDPQVVDAFEKAYREQEMPREESAADSWEHASTTQGGE
jgi:signal transduction histidine kinase